MKNGVECYKDFFGYFNALKTNCDLFLAYFGEFFETLGLLGVRLYRFGKKMCLATCRSNLMHLRKET